jgi:hypothetical protein
VLFAGKAIVVAGGVESLTTVSELLSAAVEVHEVPNSELT